MRILLVDDDERVKRGIRGLLSSRSDWAICGEAKDGVEAVEKANELRPDLVLMDISMPRMDGLQAAQIILRDIVACDVVIVTQNDPVIARQQAASVGVRNFVTKSELSQKLVGVLDCVNSNRESKTSRVQPTEKIGSVAVQAVHPSPTASTRMSPNNSLGRIESAFAGGGEMGARIRSLDWSGTPLGDFALWPQSLRSAASICIGSGFPIAIYWGQELALLYNDAWSPIAGEKHPWALGQRARDVWPEIWETIGPLFNQVLITGEATRSRDQLLPMRRHGYTEECYFDYTFTPIRGEGGIVEGVFNAVLETTERVIGERRQRTLRELATGLAESRTPSGVCQQAATILKRDRHDVPFAFFYLLSDDSSEAYLAATTDVEDKNSAVPKKVAIERISELPTSMEAALANVFLANERKQFGLTPLKLLTESPWPEPVVCAVLNPFSRPGHDQPYGVLVSGLSPRRRFDAEYEGFLDLLASQITLAISNANEYEEERKRVEALAEIDRAKTDFFSNVSHEFRTPLTLMLGPIHDLLARSQTHLSPTAREQLELANRNGARLLRLVNNLLDFSGIEAGRTQAVYEATDLAGFTAELASVFRAATEQAKLNFIVDCRPIKEMAYVDREMWEKIVLNLISNAFKFTFEGEIEITLRQLEQFAELRVRDTGVGIPAQEMPRLFERFHRIPNTRSRTYEGTGIGLALVNELVKLHSGSIHVESTPLIGSTFIVRVPLGQDHLTGRQIGGNRPLSSTAIGAAPFVEEALRWLPESDTISTPAQGWLEDVLPAGPGRGSVTRRRVLIADDNADMRLYLGRLLNGRYELSYVANGREALNVINEQAPDLIVSDVMKPELNGMELLRELRSSPETATIPVILLSARAGEESRIEGLDAGADDYLVKPFSARELLARVGARLEIARFQREAKMRDERAVREADQQLRTLIESAPFGMYVVDSGFQISIVNAMSRVAFQNVNPLIGRDFADAMRILWPEAVAAEIIRIFRHTLDTGEPYSSRDFMSPRQDIEAEQAYEWDLHRVTLPEGQFGVVCYYFDSTRLRKAEQSIAESEKRFRALAENLEVDVRQRTRDLETQNLQILQQAENVRTLSLHLTQVQDDERRRIARELHDSAGQALAALSMTLAKMERTGSSGPEHAADIKEAQEIVQEVSQEIRTTSYLLHPPFLDENGIGVAVKAYVQGVEERSGLKINLDIADNLDGIPPEVKLAVFRVVQEALTNIHRHSGSKTATIRIAYAHGAISLTVADQGKGISAEKMTAIKARESGVGMRGIKDRVEQLNGTLNIDTGNSGTSIELTLPVPGK